MITAAFLSSPCSGSICRDAACLHAVKRHEGVGRWFITMGHAGFNCRANNGNGFASKGQARRVMIQFLHR